MCHQLVLRTIPSALAVFFVAGSLHADVVYTNADVQLTVRGGAANNGLVPSDGYFRYVALHSSGEEPTWSVDPVLYSPTGAVSVLSNGLLSNPVDNAGAAESSATVGDVQVTASTTLIGTIARTTFLFNAGTASLGGYTFLFYTENDLFGVSNDVATFTGSIAGGDLQLFQFDDATMSTEQLFVVLEEVSASNAALSLFGAGIWTGWGTSLEGGDLSVLSADGSNFASTGDIGLALAWTLGSGSTASITVDYRTALSVDLPTGDDDDDDDTGTPGQVPAPAALPAGLLLLAAMGARRRR